MQAKRRSRTWLSWLTVTVLGFALLSGFVLVGGLGTEQGGVAAATAAGTTSTSASSTATSSTDVSSLAASISTSECAGPAVTGSLVLNSNFTGYMTLGLFAISQHEMPLARRFTDTGQRVTVVFSDATSAPFRFPVVPGGAVNYLVAVIPSSGTIGNASQPVESAVVPLCGTRKVTVTTTVTTTETATATDTTTVILNDTITQTAQVVLPPTDPCLTQGKAITHAKAAAYKLHRNFARHMSHIAKTTFSANFKFTGLTSLQRKAGFCCFCCG